MARAAFSSEGSTGERAASKVIHMGVSRPQLLVGCWTEGLRSLLVVSWW